MLDSRIIDLSFNKIFLKLILGEDIPLTIDTLRVKLRYTYLTGVQLTMYRQRVDPDLAASLTKLQAFGDAKSQSDKVRLLFDCCENVL